MNRLLSVIRGAMALLLLGSTVARADDGPLTHNPALYASVSFAADAQGPFSSQIVRALRAYGFSAPGVLTVTSCTGCGSSGLFGGAVAQLGTITSGTRNFTGSTDPSIVLSRIVSDATGTGNGHGFTDSSLISRTGSIGYNSYDALVSIGTAGVNVPFDHYAAFQSRPIVDGTGTLNAIFDFRSDLVTNAGTVSVRYGYDYFDASGAGTVSSQRAFQCEHLAKGTSSNYCFISQGSGLFSLADPTDATATGLGAARFAGGVNVTKMVMSAAAGQTAASGTGITVQQNGLLSEGLYTVTILSTAFICAAVTCDVTIGTLPANTRVYSVDADLTTTFACASTCTTGTLSAVLGKGAGGAEYLASFDADAATAWFGDADAEMGTLLTRAAAIQGGTFSATSQAIVVRLTSGTGNIGTGAATNLSQGTVKFRIAARVMP